MAAPKGNRFAAHDKPWTRALERHAQQNPDKLARLAAKTFDLALQGDAAARKELGERLDGKPIQPVDLDLRDHRKTAREFEDDELATIASGGSLGTVGEAEGSGSVN